MPVLWKKSKSKNRLSQEPVKNWSFHEINDEEQVGLFSIFLMIIVMCQNRFFDFFIELWLWILRTALITVKGLFLFVITAHLCVRRFSNFFKDLLRPGFRRVYKIVLSFLFFYNYFSRDLGKVLKIWEKYFHLGFKAWGLTHFRTVVLKCGFHIPVFKSYLISDM